MKHPSLEISALTALLCLTACAKNPDATVPKPVAAPTGQAAFVIHKPPAEVFEAIVDPAITSKFWFNRGSARLEQGREVQWEFPGNLVAHVSVRELVPNRRLVMEWWADGMPRTTVEWRLSPREDGGTLLGVIHSGFSGDATSVALQARDSSAGFTLVGAGMKVFLERGLQLNLVADGRACHPPGAAPAEVSVGRTSLLVRKPPAEVFEALVDPAITAKFWFVSGSDRLGPQKEVEWVFPGNVRAQVAARTFEPDRKLLLDWGLKGMSRQTMEWTFAPAGEGGTCVTVTSSGFTGDPASVADQANYMTGGFTYVLTNLKAFLEHDFKLPHGEYHERVKN